MMAPIGHMQGTATMAPEETLVDVDPTIAALLGVRPPVDAQGRALAELLKV
jgi:arylsulfatase A-like enzyme